MYQRTRSSLCAFTLCVSLIAHT